MPADTSGAAQRSHLPTAPKRRLVRAAAAVALIAMLLVILQAFRVNADENAHAAYDEAVAGATSAESVTNGWLRAGRNALSEANDVLASSDGKVEDSLRLRLRAAITRATAQISSQDKTAAMIRDTLESPRTSDASFFSPGSGYRTDTAMVKSLPVATPADVTDIGPQLAGPLQAVRDALALWQHERDRTLAARYSNTVQATGWYAELDQCAGSVDISAHYDNVPTIAEHWSCGGKLFPDDAGTIITLTGVHEGTYRVEGIVAMLNSRRHTAADLPRGYDLLYQTCQNGQSSTMSFTALTKIVE